MRPESSWLSSLRWFMSGSSVMMATSMSSEDFSETVRSTDGLSADSCSGSCGCTCGGLLYACAWFCITACAGTSSSRLNELTFGACKFWLTFSVRRVLMWKGAFRVTFFLVLIFARSTTLPLFTWLVVRRWLYSLVTRLKLLDQFAFKLRFPLCGKVMICPNQCKNFLFIFCYAWNILNQTSKGTYVRA